MSNSPKNLHSLSEMITEQHKNILVGEVNDHCLRLAVMQDKTYEWHHHPDSDELFIVQEGELVIEFQDGANAVLRSGDFFTVPAGKVHRTTARGRTVNLCLESTQAKTVFMGKVAPNEAVSEVSAERGMHT